MEEDRGQGGSAKETGVQGKGNQPLREKRRNIWNRVGASPSSSPARLVWAAQHGSLPWPRLAWLALGTWASLVGVLWISAVRLAMKG